MAQGWTDSTREDTSSTVRDQRCSRMTLEQALTATSPSYVQTPRS
jgi:hypothetical protein